MGLLSLLASSSEPFRRHPLGPALTVCDPRALVEHYTPLPTAQESKSMDASRREGDDGSTRPGPALVAEISCDTPQRDFNTAEHTGARLAFPGPGLLSPAA